MTDFLDEPPPPKSLGPRPGTRRYVDFANALIAHPGKWAALPYEGRSDDAANVASRINRGVLAAFTQGEFEACSRNGTTYVRYIGGELP